MITFFTTPKPFLGHIGVIQRNAIESWKRVHSAAEVLLFGDEEGASEAASELGIRHIPEVKRNQHGTKYLSPIFDGAQDLARHDLLCYINCDIILLSDFRSAIERVRVSAPKFMMAGRRWDTDVTALVDFSAPDWEASLRRMARQANQQRPPQWIDYFAFTRGLYYKNTPPFVIGRPGWDNWLVWHARASGARLIDASAVVQPIHQNHDYSYHPDGAAGVWQGKEAQENYALLRGNRHFATMENATDRLLPGGMRPNYRHYVVQARRKAVEARSMVWFAALGLTRPLRHRLGLRQRETPAAPAQGK